MEGRGGKRVTGGDDFYFYARYFGMLRSDLQLCLDTMSVTAGFNEEGEMGVKTFGWRNNLKQNFHLQDCNLMNGRLSFEETKSRFKVTYGLDEAGRLERRVTVEVPAPSEESLQELRRIVQWVPDLQDTSEQSLIVSYTKQFERIEVTVEWPLLF